jgi:hypothetical protein
MRIAPLVLAALCGLFAAWFFYDGFVTFPRENERIAAVAKRLADARDADDVNAARRAEAELSTLQRRTPMDIAIQKFLGVAGSVVTLVLLWVAFRPRSKPFTPPPPPPPPPPPLPVRPV